MGLSCILTDNAAQFTKPNFPGSKYLKYLTQQMELENGNLVDINKVKIIELPKRVAISKPPTLIPPTSEQISSLILSLYQSFDDLFIILVSKELHPTYSLMEENVSKLHGRAAIHLIDSQSIAVGEGQIVQCAADLLAKNTPGNQAEEYLRETIPHVYTLLCTPNLSYLHKAGFIDVGQFMVGEMMSLLPIFSLEDGKLNPLDKVKNYRNVIDYFLEFIEEFDDLDNVSFIHPSGSVLSEAKVIRQQMEENYPGVNYYELSINPFLASLIGPRGMGIVISEKIDL
jgi:DegV family protein with EDD domain